MYIFKMYKGKNDPSKEKNDYGNKIKMSGTQTSEHLKYIRQRHRKVIEMSKYINVKVKE